MRLNIHGAFSYFEKVPIVVQVFKSTLRIFESKYTEICKHKLVFHPLI